MEKFDYKKEYKDLYQPKTKPSIIEIPEMIFIAIDGKGDPNTSDEYKDALEILYGLSFTIKMSKMSRALSRKDILSTLFRLWKVSGMWMMRNLTAQILQIKTVFAGYP